MSDTQHERNRCLVFGCSNYSDQGIFVGEMCKPCHESITTGKIGRTTSFLGDIKRELGEARDCAEILHRHLQELGEKYAGGPVSSLPPLPWSQPDLSREALIAALKGGKG